MIRKIQFLIVVLATSFACAQTTITGNVFDEYLEPFPGANIVAPGANTSSNYDGTFKITVKNLPVVLKITSVGYSEENVVVTDPNQELNIILKETFGLDQVVISASRTPERVMESPVTIERIDEKTIKNTASPNFYEGLRNLKGIDILDNNYLTKTVVSNRGFANTDNARFVQLVDGVDTAVPVFDYAIGNLFGLNELDVKNVEILPGAASALYGANAFNGILFMTSKNPFEDTGASVYTKAGILHETDRGAKGFIDAGFRYASNYEDWFAVKLSATYQEATDWLANDLSDINSNGGTRLTNPNYNGVNVYGDEISLNLVDLAVLADGTALGPLLNPLGQLSSGAENVRISRTGFSENSIVDYGVSNVLFDFSLHFKPWKNSTEIILATKQSIGNNIAQASNRYFQKNSSMQHYKLELKGDDYFVRAYYNENNAGDTYDSKLVGVAATQGWRANGTWYTDYATAFFGALQGNGISAGDHNAARNYADFLSAVNYNDNGLPTEGSEELSTIADQVKITDLRNGGGKITERSGYYNVDANWNLNNYIDFADVQVGGNFRSFALQSDGQIYTDYDGILRYRQFGLYTQLQKKFADDRLKFTGTLRYDKSKNFNGNFSPRATLSYALGDKRDHNFRIGFQTGFRNPTSQDQYSGLTIGNLILLGSVQDNLDRFASDVTFVSDQTLSREVIGSEAFENSFTASSVEAYQTDFRSKVITAQSTAVLPDFSLLEVANFDKVTPETVRSFELGYRGAIDLNSKLLEFDIVGYYNFHEDFITSTEVVVPLYGTVDDLLSGSGVAIASNDFQRFEISTNAKSTIKAFGYALGFNTKVFENFDLSGSYAFSDFSIDDNDDIDFDPAFNTPKHALKLQFGNEKLFENIGFAINTRWQDAFLYQTRFTEQTIPARFTLDTQVNYNIPAINSYIKLGATNLFGKGYNSVPESGRIGSQYFISFVVNN